LRPALAPGGRLVLANRTNFQDAALAAAAPPGYTLVGPPDLSLPGQFVAASSPRSRHEPRRALRHRHAHARVHPCLPGGGESARRGSGSTRGEGATPVLALEHPPRF
jgi:hypothetical protein